MARTEVRGTFSQFGPRRPASAGRLARTLGSAMQAKWYSSRVSAWRRVLNSHEAAQPQMPAPAEQSSSQNLIMRQTSAIANYWPAPWQVKRSHFLQRLGIQSVRGAAAAKPGGQVSGHGQRRLEHVAHHGFRRGARSTCSGQCWATVPWQIRHQLEQGPALPNHSLKLSTNGMAPGPCNALEYHAPHGPSAIPLAPA